MKKDKNWLKEEVFELYPSHDVMYVSPDYEAVAKTETISKVLELIDQLDEPERPVIPKFVADWIEEKRLNISDLHTENPERFFLFLGHRLHYATLASTNIGVWVFGGNEEKLYQALKYGYEVEKEKQYYVMNKENELILGWSQSAYMTPCIEGYEYMKHTGRENLFQLTEQEIKDYDERYWAFAEEVTE